MLTPLDIQNKEFGKTFRGYRESEVDSFLDEIIIDYEKVYKENLELKDKIVLLNERLKQYDDLEETLKETLVVAQNTADEVTSSARQKSKLIIREAEEEARKIADEAYEEVKDIEEQYRILKKEIFIFKTRFKSFMESQLLALNDYYDKIEDSDRETMKVKDLEKETINIEDSDIKNEEIKEVKLDSEEENLGA